MKFYGDMNLSEGTALKNLTVDSGAAFPVNPNLGELFYLTSGITGLYAHDGAEWIRLALSSDQLESHSHPEYLTESEANSMYAGLGHIHSANQHLIVKKNPSTGEYSSVGAAIAAASALTPSSTNRIVVHVHPGEYSEMPFTVPGYVYVVGFDPWNSAHIATADQFQDFITVSPNGGMFNCAVSGPSADGKSAIIQTASGTIKLYWLNIKNGWAGVTLAPVSGVARCHAIGVVTDGASTTRRVFNIDNPVGVGVLIAMQSGPMSGTNMTYGVYLNGSNANATLDLCQFRTSGITSVYADGGAVVRGISCSFAQGLTAIHVGSNGATKVDMHGSQIKPNGYTNDIKIDSASAIVTFSGVATESKITVAEGAHFTASFADSTSGVDGQVILGELWIGNKNVKTPLASYIQADKNTGVVSGGELSRGNGAYEINVSAGTGFIDTANGLKLVSWNQQTVTAPANVQNYTIAVDVNGSIGFYAAGSISDISYLSLGEITSDNSTVTAFVESRILLPQFRPSFHNYVEHVIGPISKSGGVVTASGLSLNVTASTFFSCEREHYSAAATGLSFNYWYKNGAGGWNTLMNQTSISNSQWDDGSGTLATMAAGKFRRDVIFVTSTTGQTPATEFHVIMGQELFDAEVDAVTNPSVPDILMHRGCRLASIIVETSATSCSIIDQRPKLGQFSAPSTGVTNHGDLSGLAANDHPQYILNTTKGQANGVATLDENSKLVLSQLPTISHGDQAGGTLHAIATTSNAGFMSATDKTKLDGLPSGGYVLPISSATVLGGVKVTGPGVKIDAVTGELRGSTNHAHSVISPMTGNSTMPLDNPTITDGTEFATCTITPKRSSSKIDISCTLQTGTSGTSGGVAVTVWRDGVLVGGGVTHGHNHGGSQNTQIPITVRILDSVIAVDVPVTYAFRIGSYGGSSTWYLGRAVLGTWGGVIAASNSIYIEELVH